MQNLTQVKRFYLILLLSILPACVPPPIQTDTPVPLQMKNQPTSNSEQPIEPPTQGNYQAQLQNQDLSFGLTYLSSDGNRKIYGSGAVPFRLPIDISLPGKPIWLIASPVKDGIVWTAALEDGSTLSYHIDPNGVVSEELFRIDLDPGMPPSAISADNIFSLVLVNDPAQSPLSHPVYLPLSDRRAYITKAGELNIVDASDQLVASLDVNALPDARILRDDNDRLLLLSDPTERYTHGVLGDHIEAAGFTLVKTLPEPHVLLHTTLPNNEVIEGISPIWTDLTGDDQAEIIVTVSDLDLGAGIVIFDEMGEKIAQGPKFGIPFRWRHQIAASNFAPGGELELAVVRTPHIAGTVDFYQLVDGKLTITAQYPGITSHTLGSRNLDLSAAGDFDADGRSELIVLNPDLSELIAVRRTPSGAEQAWNLPLDGFVSSNLAGAPLPDGRIALGLGRSDNVLRIWLPEE